MSAATGAERPVRNRTPWSLSTWIARTCSVSPPEQGGALPCHDTQVEQRIDWEFSPTRPPVHTFSFTDNRIEAERVDPAIIDRHHNGNALSTLARRTWSITLGAVAMWLTWATVRLVNPTDALATVTITATGICTALLVTAHAMTKRQPTGNTRTADR